MLLIARIRRSMCMRKDQLLGLLLKLDFGNNDTLKNAAVNIDMPRCPRVLDEETLFLQSIISTDGREHPLSVGDRDLILKFRAHNTDPRSLDGDRRDVSGYSNPHLAVLVYSDQSVADADAANCRRLHASLATKNFRSISTG